MAQKTKSGLQMGLTVGIAMGAAYVASRQVQESSIWLRALVAAMAAGVAAMIVIFITGLLIRRREARHEDAEK